MNISYIFMLDGMSTPPLIGTRPLKSFKNSPLPHRYLYLHPFLLLFSICFLLKFLPEGCVPRQCISNKRFIEIDYLRNYTGLSIDTWQTTPVPDGVTRGLILILEGTGTNPRPRIRPLVFQIVTCSICNLVLKLHNPMKICVTRL